MDALLRVVGAEHVAAAHQHIYPGLGQKGGRFAVHATVHLDEGFRTALGDELAQAPYLGVGVLDEALTTEAGV